MYIIYYPSLSCVCVYIYISNTAKGFVHFLTFGFDAVPFLNHEGDVDELVLETDAF